MTTHRLHFHALYWGDEAVVGIESLAVLHRDRQRCECTRRDVPRSTSKSLLELVRDPADQFEGRGVCGDRESENGAVGTSIASYGSRAPWFYQTVMLGKEGTICTVPPHGGNVRDQHHAPALVSSAARDGSVASVRHEVEGVEAARDRLQAKRRALDAGFG